MNTFKRAACIICVAVIALSYITAIVSVFLKSENWLTYLKSAIYITVVFPAILYAILLIEKHLKNKKDKDGKDN